MVKNPPASVGDTRDMGSILKLGRSPGVGNGNPLQYSCLENPMDRRAWGPTVHRVAEESDMTEHVRVLARMHTRAHTHTFDAKIFTNVISSYRIDPFAII